MLMPFVKSSRSAAAGRRSAGRLLPELRGLLLGLAVAFALRRVLLYCAYGTIITPRLVILGRTLELGSRAPMSSGSGSGSLVSSIYSESYLQ